MVESFKGSYGFSDREGLSEHLDLVVGLEASRRRTLRL